MTTGFMKDIHHLKELILKKELCVEENEFYEVEYFDATLGLDEDTKEILNNRIKELKD